MTRPPLTSNKASVTSEQSLYCHQIEPPLLSNRTSVAIKQSLCPRHSDIAANSTECQHGVHGTIFRNIRNSASPTN
ncbi:hypothetical protein [Bacteroides pyogenes]|uniref:hypothetical protein n=1 Tax=Bacteroides pyogenes TaxID=310300 RepID=UPI002A81EA41|nr:hypothetical protein [Bacteroides pyogenes]